MELSCTPQCRSIQHGDIITAAITKRSISDEDLCAFLNYTCADCHSVKDSCGRNALHVAASCGRLNLVKWLVEKRHAAIDAKDDESGVTPLQRSIFYGHLDIAVELIRLGASLSQVDANGLTALEHAMKDRPRFSRKLTADDINENWELYAWGFNTNHVLGAQEAKTLPEYWEDFHKVYPGVSVAYASLNQFHSLIVTHGGNVYSCGHGQGGRLGLGVESTVIRPKLISFKENGNSKTEDFQCQIACASRDHSLFLGTDQSVYSCGLNTHRVLGLGPKPPEKELSPRRIKSLSNIIGICAGQYHSVAWSKNAIYTWGLNAGQLGYKLSDSSKHVVFPRLVKVTASPINLSHVAASDAATALSTKCGDIYVLHEYMCRKIVSKDLSVTTISVIGGKLNTQLDEEFKSYELKVVALTNSGNILLWQESDQKLRRCYFSISRAIIIKQVFLNLNEVLLATTDHEIFKGYFRPRKNKAIIKEDKDSKPKSEFHKFIEKNECISVKLEKMPKIHRARAVYSDPKGNNYFILQYPPYTYFLEPKIAESTYIEDFRNLLEIQDESIADISFKVDQEVFQAHKYILASRLDIFQEIFKIFPNDCVKVTNVCVEDFRKFLDDIYCNLNIRYKSSRDKHKNKLAESECEINFHSLQKLLKEFDNKHFHFQLSQFPQYYDVTIKCNDGEVKAHKCVLFTRVDYFNSLFSTRWSSSIDDITFPVPTSIARDILYFIYSDKLTEYKDIDRLSKILVLSDQLLINRLKDICELFLSRQIKLKNAVQLLKFATAYNALQLKNCCLEFLACNLAEFLELQLLDDLDIALLKDLSETYIKFKSQTWCRVITPYSTAPIDSEILAISTKYPINLEEELIEKSPPKSSQKRRRPRTISTHSIGEETTFEMQLENVAENKNNNKENEEKFEKNEAESDNALKKRLQAINSGIMKLEKENIAEDYMNLKIVINRNSFNDFPDLNSPPKAFSHNKLNTPKSEGKIKITKLSQKERKRLYSEGSNNANANPISESPKNPWKVIPSTSISPGTSPGADFSGINAIVLNEKKQKENLIKIKSKPLSLTQIEEAAIVDLHKFYNVDNIFDEIIEIQRVAIGDIAAPTWVPSSKS